MRAFRARRRLAAVAALTALIGSFVTPGGPAAAAGGPAAAAPAGANSCPPLPLVDVPVPLGIEGVTPFAEPTLSWRPVAGINEYVVLVLLESDQEQVVAGPIHVVGRTSVTVAGLPQYTRMRWKVKTECDEHYSTFSPSTYFTIEPDAAACPPAQVFPFGPQPGTIGDPQPTFSWRAVPGATSYTVYVQSGTSDAIFAREQDIHGTVFTPPQPLPVGVPLRWKVKAEGVAAVGCTGQYSPIIYFDIGTPNPCRYLAPATPYGPQGTLIRNRPTFRWGTAPGATFHTLVVLRADTGAFLLGEVAYGAEFTPTADLPAGVELRWFLQGSNGCGDGAYSAAPQFRIR